MNTTAAAIQAGVTVPTIRTWCRIGAVAAIKQAGRWVIDAASLAWRITLGKERRMTGTPRPWDDDHPNIDLLTETIQAGVPIEAIVDKIGANTLRFGTRPFSRRDEDRILGMLHARQERNRLLDELAHLATCLGHDGAAKRTAADARLSDAELRKMIADSRAYARGKGIDVRTEAEKQPRPATARQVDYILDLLAARKRSGEGGGFFYGPTDRAGIEALSMDDASSYIRSLKGDY